MAISNADSASLLGEFIAIRRHPGFKAAMYANAGRDLQHYLTHHTMRRYSKDLASFYAAFFAVYLSFAEEGLTARTFTDTCLRTGLCSTGRAETLLSYMRGRGDLTTEDAHSGRRARKLIPSQALIDFCGDRVRDQAASYALLAPDGAEIVRRCEDKRFVASVLRASGPTILAGVGDHQDQPETVVVNFFAKRAAGLNVLYAIFTRHPDLPLSDTPFKLSVSGMAAMLGISRPHILKLLQLLSRGEVVADLTARGHDRWAGAFRNGDQVVMTRGAG